MKGMIILGLLMALQGLALATEVDFVYRRDELRPPELPDERLMEQVFFSEAIEQHRELKRIKYHIINGDIARAKLMLSELRYVKTRLQPVIDRFDAIIAFIEGDYERSFTRLSNPALQTIPQFSRICVLKVLNAVILSRVDQLSEDWGRCRVENATNMNASNVVWLDTLVQLRLRPVKGITRVPFTGVRLASFEARDLKILLKLSLYLNQDKLLLEELPNVTVEQLQDPEVRELVGQIYFRNGALVNSFRYISDLASPNSENIKGNLYILREKFELAYAQHKLALNQKANSQNAIERLLPLAWLLGDWEGGARYAGMAIASPRTQINKLTILAAFQMQKGDYAGSRRTLQRVRETSRRGSELEVNQILSFSALMENDQAELRKQAELGCRRGDFANCWVVTQLLQWDAFPLTLRREEEIPEGGGWQTLTAGLIDEPFKEKTVFVNQLDIEELDDALIQLVQKTP
jgi:hypothetical protein